MRRTLPVTGLACGVVVTAALAQAPAAAGAGPSVFRADTRLVEVSVVVHDKKGAPVAGTDARGFHAARGRHSRSRSPSSRRSRRSQDRPSHGGSAPRRSGRAAGLQQPHSTAPRRTAASPRSCSIASTRGSRISVRRAIRSSGSSNRSPARAIASRSTRSSRDRVKVLHDFTSDTASLIRAISRPDRGRPSARRSAISPPGSPITTQDMTQMMLANRVSHTLDALGRDRQTSRGHSRPQESRLDLVRHTVLTVRDRNAGDAGRARRPRHRRCQRRDLSGRRARPGRAPACAPAETMPEVAAMKGRVDFGPAAAAAEASRRRCRTSTRSRRSPPAPAAARSSTATTSHSAIRAAVDDGRVTYVLGYYPSHGKWDGSFHRVTVKVNRPDRRGPASVRLPRVLRPGQAAVRETGRRPARGSSQPASSRPASD